MIPLPTIPGGFALALADPPWRWKPWSWETGASRSPDYCTEPLESIAALPVPGIMANDSCLVMWAIASMLPEALELMKHWGFTPKTGAVWVKDRIGLGYWWRQQHEHLLLGTRGRFRAPPARLRFPSVIHAPRPSLHSEKPEEVARMLEAMFPGAAKVELFARNHRPGWACWGDELKGADQ